MDNDNVLTIEKDVLFFAFRYALGRMSYAPYVIMNAIEENINNIPSEDINKYIKEIYECENYGMDFDKESWLKFAKYLEDVSKSRL